MRGLATAKVREKTHKKGDRKGEKFDMQSGKIIIGSEGKSF